jgi:hypothetical protein
MWRLGNFENPLEFFEFLKFEFRQLINFFKKKRKEKKAD